VLVCVSVSVLGLVSVLVSVGPFGGA